MLPVIGQHLATILRMQSLARARGATPTMCLISPSIVENVALELAALNVLTPKLHALTGAQWVERLQTPGRIKFSGLGLAIGAPKEPPDPVQGPVLLQLVEAVEPEPTS